jgi:hypothetical protein
LERIREANHGDKKLAVIKNRQLLHPGPIEPEVLDADALLALCPSEPEQVQRPSALPPSVLRPGPKPESARSTSDDPRDERLLKVVFPDGKFLEAIYIRVPADAGFTPSPFRRAELSADQLGARPSDEIARQLRTLMQGMQPLRLPCIELTYQSEADVWWPSSNGAHISKMASILAKHEKCAVWWPIGVPFERIGKSKSKGILSGMNPAQRLNLHAALIDRQQIRIIDWIPIPEDQFERVPGKGTHIVFITTPMTPDNPGGPGVQKFRAYFNTVQVVTNNGTTLGPSLDIVASCHRLWNPYCKPQRAAQHASEPSTSLGKRAPESGDEDEVEPKRRKTEASVGNNGNGKRKRQPDDADTTSVVAKKPKVASPPPTESVDEPGVRTAIAAARDNRRYKFKYEPRVAAFYERPPMNEEELNAHFRKWDRLRAGGKRTDADKFGRTFTRADPKPGTLYSQPVTLHIVFTPPHRNCRICRSWERRRLASQESRTGPRRRCGGTSSGKARRR